MLLLLLILGIAAIVVAGSMGFNTSYVPAPLDEGTRLESSVTKTADFNGAALDLGSGYAPGGPGQRFSAVIDVSALDFTTTDETYAFHVEQSADNSTWTDVSVPVSFTAAGVKAIPVFVSARYVRVVLDVGGTTPSITYEAWLVAHHGN